MYHCTSYVCDEQYAKFLAITRKKTELFFAVLNIY